MAAIRNFVRIARHHSHEPSNQQKAMAIYHAPFQSNDHASSQSLIPIIGGNNRTQTRLHVLALAQQAENELQCLLTRRSEIANRLAQLQRAIRGLASLYREKVDIQLPELFTSALRTKALADPAASVVIQFEPKKFRTGPRLQRACRIALMEIAGPASAGDIYDRIKRRESFQFNHYKRPLMAIINVLNTLVREGEAIAVNEGNWQCWQWKLHQSGVEEPTNSAHPLIQSQPSC